MKTCSLCKIEKNIEEFTTKTGNITTKCKKCLSELQKMWSIKNKDKVKKTKHKTYLKHKENILKKTKEWVQKNRKKSNEIKRQWKIRNKEDYLKQQREKASELYHSDDFYYKKTRARDALRKEIRKGNILRGDICCLCERKCKTEAHHEDYNLPFEVKWLCKKCHSFIHSKYALELVEKYLPYEP